MLMKCLNCTFYIGIDSKTREKREIEKRNIVMTWKTLCCSLLFLFFIVSYSKFYVYGWLLHNSQVIGRRKRNRLTIVNMGKKHYWVFSYIENAWYFTSYSITLIQIYDKENILFRLIDLINNFNEVNLLISKARCH